MADEPYQQGLRISLMGLFVNAGLGIVKLLAGLVGRSTALVADAVESFCDVVSSLVVWSGLHIARQPPDRNHPYGHGRAETLSALVVTVMLAGAGIGIAVEAVSQIRNPQVCPAPFTLWVLVFIIATKETMFQLARRTARRTDSSALLADAWHHRSDAITSIVAAGGIAVAVFGGPEYAVADDWAALFASAVILFNAWRIMQPPVQELMDRHSPEIAAQARAVAQGVPDVQGVEKVFARKIGLQYWVDIHIEVDPQMSVKRAHGVSHAAKDAICAAMPNVQDVLVHIEPHDGDREPSKS